jgi:hypothetical protein
VRDVARGQETVAWPENKHLLSYSDLEFPGKNKVHFIFTRMRMTGNAHPRRETHVQQTIGSSRVFARQTDSTDAYIKVIAL